MIAFLTLGQTLAALLAPELVIGHARRTARFIGFIVAIIDTIALSPGWDTVAVIAAKVQWRIARTILFITPVRALPNVIALGIPMETSTI